MIYILQVDKTDRLRAFTDYNKAINVAHLHAWDRGIDFCDDPDLEINDDESGYTICYSGEYVAEIQKVELEY